MKQKKWIWICLIILLLAAASPILTTQAAHITQNESVLAKKKAAANSKKNGITKKERNAYFSKSAFIGSSIGVGLKSYMNSKGNGYLGNPVMLVQGCYSLANDASKKSTYKIGYKGRKYKAKDAVAAAKVKRVFICMGTNDLWKDAKSTAKDYMQYIKGIQRRNPGVVIFIESTPPMCSARCRGHLTNKSIHTLNRIMKNYSKKKKDVYYINIAKGITDSNGGLKRKYSSDGYVHLTRSAYAIWMENVTTYVDQLLAAEKKAKQAVKQAEKYPTAANYDKAWNYVHVLEKSTVKTNLKKRLVKIKTMPTETE